MGKAIPLTDADLQQIRAMHGDGKSAAQIAASLGRSVSTVSRRAKRMGISFDRAQTAAATRAHQVDAAARRAAITGRLYTRAERILGILESGSFQVTGQSMDGIIVRELDFVPDGSELNLSRAIGQYLKTAADLEKVDTGSGSDHALSAIGQIGDALAAAARALAE